MKASTKKLVDALLACEPTPERSALLERARAGAYHDFDSRSATPIRDLVYALTLAARRLGGVRAAELYELAERAKHGDFDAGRDEHEIVTRKA